MNKRQFFEKIWKDTSKRLPPKTDEKFLVYSVDGQGPFLLTGEHINVSCNKEKHYFWYKYYTPIYPPKEFSKRTKPKNKKTGN